MIVNALADKPLPVYGDGLNVRDWLYVEDHCRAIDLIIRNGRIGEIYNVGGHNEMSNISIVRLICHEKETAYLIWSASKIVVDAEWVLPRKRYMFEGISLYGFHDPEPYLTRHYGTGFRTLPPEELRRVGINKIDYQGAEIEQ